MAQTWGSERSVSTPSVCMAAHSQPEHSDLPEQGKQEKVLSTRGSPQDRLGHSPTVPQRAQHSQGQGEQCWAGQNHPKTTESQLRCPKTGSGRLWGKCDGPWWGASLLPAAAQQCWCDAMCKWELQWPGCTKALVSWVQQWAAQSALWDRARVGQPIQHPHIDPGSRAAPQCHILLGWFITALEETEWWPWAAPELWVCPSHNTHGNVPFQA